MELLYFISGILTVGIVYSIVLLRKNQSSYADATARLQSHLNISSLRYEEMNEDLKAMEDLVMDLTSKMEKDQYSSVSEINKSIGEIKEMTNAMNVRISANQKIMETSISRTSTEINTLKNSFKQLGQDPNFIR